MPDKLVLQIRKTCGLQRLIQAFEEIGHEDVQTLHRGRLHDREVAAPIERIGKRFELGERGGRCVRGPAPAVAAVRPKHRDAHSPAA